MTTNGNEKLVKTSNEFYCTKCNYFTSRKYNLDLHYKTIKHKNSTMTTEINDSLVKTSKIHKCLTCDKKFNDRSGLWRHSKKCSNDKTFETNNQMKEFNFDKKDELIEYLIKENKEIKEIILELAKKESYNNCYNTSNSHNKTFNLNLFLNEQCKDAMNIMEFVDSLQIKLSDLEKVGELGYINGISEIIIKNLKALDIYKRPIHCTDSKREIIYIKDENKWEKEDQENNKMRKAIKYVAHKNTKLLKEYREKYPDCEKSSSKKSDDYNKIVIETFGGGSSTDGIDCEAKIIKKIAKEITIDKNII